ncbi:fimbrial protein [Serratia aquatilis]|uniref:Fimbrial protein n=1 Tax=Serratia aquatilis TaxID=1737515 RepID=A0ABV6E827_9GAMM
MTLFFEFFKSPMCFFKKRFEYIDYFQSLIRLPSPSLRYKVLLLVFLCLGVKCTYAQIGTPRTFWAVGMPITFIDINDLHFPSDQAGATVSKAFFVGGYRYYFQYYAPNRPTDVIYPTALVHLYGVSNFPVSTINPGYLKLNDDIDVQLGMNSWQSSFFTVPFDWRLVSAIQLSDAGGFSYTNSDWLRIDMKLKLRRNIIGGLTLLPNEILIAEVYGGLTYGQYTTPPGVRSPTPAFRFFLKGQMAPIPAKCNIRVKNQGEYNVNFGDLSSAEIGSDGSRYGKSILLDYRCNNDYNLPIKITLVASQSAFSSDYIASSNKDLGIIMKYNGNVVRPNSSFNTRLQNGQGHDVIYFSPVKNPTQKTIVDGEFTANAVLMMSVQ